MSRFHAFLNKLNASELDQRNYHPLYQRASCPPYAFSLFTIEDTLPFVRRVIVTPKRPGRGEIRPVRGVILFTSRKWDTFVLSMQTTRRGCVGWMKELYEGTHCQTHEQRTIFSTVMCGH